MTSKQAFKHWERVVSDPEVAEKIVLGWRAVRKSVICEAWRETHYKIIHNAIHSFNLPNTFNDPSRIKVCPKFGTLNTDMWHGIWKCTPIQHFWEEVRGLINKMCGTNLILQAEQMIFHCVRPPERPGGSTFATDTPNLSGGALLHISLLAAICCITKMWLSNALPTAQMVVTQLRAYLQMDRLFTERNPETGEKGFLQKLNNFVLQHMS